MRCLVSRFRQRGRSQSVHAHTHTSTGTRALLRLLLFRRGFERSFPRGLAPSCVFIVELVCALRLMLDPCRHSHTSVHATSATASSDSSAATTTTAFFIEQGRKEQICPSRQLYDMVLLCSASTKPKRGGQKEQLTIWPTLSILKSSLRALSLICTLFLKRNIVFVDPRDPCLLSTSAYIW